MFKSIKWKIILVYCLLIFIAMTIVGVFMVGNFKHQQLEYRDDSITKKIESMLETSDYLFQADWDSYESLMQENINHWKLDVMEAVYIIKNEDSPRILASSYIDRAVEEGKTIEDYNFTKPDLVKKAFEDRKAVFYSDNSRKDIMVRHIAYPIAGEDGRVNGVVYATSNLEDIYDTISDSRKILLNATFLALVITIVLGFFITSTITEPIRDVTEKAEKVAKGDFDQFVDTKSDNEIGQLANMFNYLTLRLKSSIQEIDLERAKLDTIFKYMADGVIAIDKNNRLIHANPIALEILELEDENVDLMSREDVSNKILNLGELDYDNIDTLKTDEIIYIDSNIYRLRYAPFKNEENSIAGVIIVFQDITEQQKLDNMRREFVANVSHELKTPITTIKSYTETLMGFKDIDNDTSNNFLSVIDNECDRMNRIVKDLLQLSNMDYKKIVWNKVSFPIDELVKDTLIKLNLYFKEKDQNIRVNIAKNQPNVYGDRDGIQQVLINIIFNSIKYTDVGGNISILGKVNYDRYILTIRDDGIGVPEEDQERIFERFYRVDKGRARKSGGSGLGLSIAKQIVETQGGDIILKSKYGEGTRVDIILPLG